MLLYIPFNLPYNSVTHFHILTSNKEAITRILQVQFFPVELLHMEKNTPLDIT